jgi:cell wall-associated NlpC family hydrolase
MDANGMEKGALIRVGQIIKVPTNTYFTDEKIIKDVLAKQEEKARIARGIHKVKSGDTLFSIAMKNHVSLKDIMKYNKLKVNSVLKIGQELKVTKKASYITAKKSTKKRKSTKTKLVTKKYKIRRGDTLSKIAKRYKISVKKLRALNGLGRKSKLKIGKTLVVGKRVVKPKKKRKYIVKRGDTVWLIAKKNNTTVKEIRKLNNLTRKSKIKKGMVLTIAPKSKKSRKSTRVASTHKASKGRRNSALSVLNGKSNRRGSSNSRVIRTAKRYLGKRYVWGAVGPNKFDCSGFTQYVIRKSKGVRIPRVSRKQAYYGKYVSRSNLRAGDLIFFDTSHRRRGYVNHVGIYIGGNKFIHASSARHRVVITSLNRPFYKARFKWGRRVN